MVRVKDSIKQSGRDCEVVMQKTKVLEAKLLEWFVDGEVDYLRDWSFEYAHCEASLSGINVKERKYFYLQAIRRSEILEEAYEKVMQAVEENEGKEIVRMEIGLPSYEEIEGAVRKQMKRKKR